MLPSLVEIFAIIVLVLLVGYGIIMEVSKYINLQSDPTISSALTSEEQEKLIDKYICMPSESNNMWSILIIAFCTAIVIVLITSFFGLFLSILIFVGLTLLIAVCMFVGQWFLFKNILNELCKKVEDTNDRSVNNNRVKTNIENQSETVLIGSSNISTIIGRIRLK